MCIIYSSTSATVLQRITERSVSTVRGYIVTAVLLLPFPPEVARLAVSLSQVLTVSTKF